MSSREIEAGKFQLRDHSPSFFGAGRRRDEMHLPVAVVPFAVEPPGLRIEREQAADAASGFRDQRRTGAGARIRQRKAGGPRHHDLVGGEFRRNVVRQRLDHHPMGRHQRIESDELLRLLETAGGSERGDDQQCVADLAVAQAMQRLRRLNGITTLARPTS